MPQVICTVSNCKYHTEDNGCDAEKILVTVVGNTDKTKFTPAHGKFETICETFEAVE